MLPLPVVDTRAVAVVSAVKREGGTVGIAPVTLVLRDAALVIEVVTPREEIRAVAEALASVREAERWVRLFAQADQSYVLPLGTYGYFADLITQTDKI